jgi:hypothetical protein
MAKYTKFPGGIDDYSTLFRAQDNVTTALAGNVDSTSSMIMVVDATSFPEAGVITIHNRNFSDFEKIYYTTRTHNTFLNLTRPQARGWHAGCEVSVSMLNTEDYHNANTEAIIAIEKYLGDSTAAVIVQIDETTGVAYIQDPTRARNLSTSRNMLSFQRGRKKLDSQYLRFGELATQVHGPRLLRHATLTGLTIQTENSADAWFQIRKNGLPTNLLNVQLNNVQSRELDNITVDLYKGDYIQLYMDVTSGTVDSPIVQLEYAWRF